MPPRRIKRVRPRRIKCKKISDVDPLSALVEQAAKKLPLPMKLIQQAHSIHITAPKRHRSWMVGKLLELLPSAHPIPQEPHLVKARLVYGVQYVRAKRQGKEIDELLLRNVRAAYGVKRCSFDPDLVILFNLWNEENAMAVKKVSKKAVKKVEKKNDTLITENIAAKIGSVRRPRIDFLGFGVSAVIRCLGKQGLKGSEVMRVMEANNIEVKRATVNTYVQAGRTGTRGKPADLTSAQIRTCMDQAQMEVK